MRLISTSSPIKLTPLLLFSTLPLLARSSSTLASMASTTSNLPPQAPLSEFPSLAQHINEASAPNPDSISPLAQQRIADAQALFGAKPTMDIFKRSWSPDATFEDPIAHCNGWRAYASQWWGMKIFSTTETKAWRLTKDTPQEVEYAQKQLYGISRIGFEKEMVSIVNMKLGNDGRITYFQDRWDGKGMPGAWAWPLRRLNSFTVPFMVSAPKAHPDQGGTDPNERKEL